MAISTYMTFLMHKDTDWKKLIDIKEFPDLGGAPEMIETTTLSDAMKTFIEGIQNSNALSFPANYTLDEYKKLNALKGKEQELAVWLGGTKVGDTVTPTGSNGKYKFKGTVSVFVKGAGTNAPVEMTITVAPSTEITPDA